MRRRGRGLASTLICWG